MKLTINVNTHNQQRRLGVNKITFRTSIDGPILKVKVCLTKKKEQQLRTIKIEIKNVAKVV